MLPRKTSLAILTVALLIGILARAKVLKEVDVSGVTDFRPRESAPAEPLLKHPYRGVVIPGAGQKKASLLEDSGNQLYPFYHALELAKAKEGVARILHYGDSPTTADSITADMRSLLQERFGDAGHGFVLIAKPWPWYGHRGVEVHGSGWKIEAASQNRAKDGYHGLGGVSFTGSPGAVSRIHLETPHARVEVEFLRQPEGGVFTVAARDLQGGDVQVGEVDTRGEKEPGFAQLQLPEGGATDVVIAVKSGSVRLFGASFEKDSLGVIYNSLGVNGGQIQMVLRYYDRTQWAEQLQHQRPDLVILNYGTNESGFASYIDKLYGKELREVIARVKTALPGTPILIMSPMDRGEKRSDGSIGTIATLPKLVSIQREAAAETGCAFFNTFEAMGGEGTMGRWYTMQPRLVSADFMHPLPQGARKVGLLLDEALVSGYEQYEAQRKALPVTRQVTEKR
jgi:lysophospholipase L1-like esterase